MSKTNLLAVGGLLAALLSCSRGHESEMPQSPEASSQDRVAVQLGLDMKGLVQTKSLGTVDAWNGTQKLFIYGFPFVNGEPDWENPFIDNVGAFSPASGTSGAINLYNPAITAQNEPFYYQEGTTYDFYGYYVDDAAENWDNGAPVTQMYQEGLAVWMNLNGQQDIMHAQTDRALAAADGGISLERVYSAYAARRGVHPELTFSHALSRFRFRLLSGSQQAHEQVTVDALAMEGDSRAALVVAGPEPGKFVFSDPKAWMDLPMAAAVSLPEADGSKTTLDGSIMLTPGYDSYKLRLHMNQTGVTESAANTSELEVKLEDLVGAVEPLSVAGHSYWVNITVYGLSEVVLSVTLADWDVAGTVEIDPDADELISATTPAPVTSEGGNVSVTLHRDANTQYTYTLDSDWVHIADAPAPAPQGPVTKASEPVEETLYFTVDPNPGTTRVANIRFYVNGMPDAVIQISQEGASDFPDAYGIYPRGSSTTITEHVMDAGTELMGVYALSSQRWSRILVPATNTVYELGPIPASLSLDQEFDATYSVTVAGEVTSTQQVHVKVLSVQGRKVKMLDSSRLIGFTLIY
jgi:hypothetical protein